MDLEISTFRAAIILTLSLVFVHQITLYDPKSITWQVKIASRPTAAVTLVIGAENFGSVERETFEICFN